MSAWVTRGGTFSGQTRAWLTGVRGVPHAAGGQHRGVPCPHPTPRRDELQGECRPLGLPGPGEPQRWSWLAV